MAAFITAYLDYCRAVNHLAFVLYAASVRRRIEAQSRRGTREGTRMAENDYQVCHCGANCDYLNVFVDEPCWGEVGPLGLSGDDDFGHFCEGHEPRYYGDAYKPKPPTSADTGTGSDD